MSRPGNYITPAGQALRGHVLTLAARPEGFSRRLDKGSYNPKTLESVSLWLAKRGLIIKATHGVDVRFFTRSNDVKAFMSQRQPFVSGTTPERKSFADDAQIVHTERTKYTVIPTPAPRFAAVDRLAFQHGY